MPKILGVDNGSISASHSLEKKDKFWVKKKTYKLVYLVLADSLADDEEDILATAGIPPLFYPYNGTVCKKRTPTETTRVVHPVSGVSSALWEVACDFDSDIDPDQNQDPDQKTPTVRWYGETDEEVLEKDAITGDPIETEAGEPIIITTPVVHPVLEISRYEPYPFDPDTMLDYAHHTNSTVFWGAPQGSALMLPMEVDEEIIEKVKWCKVVYKIKFRIKKDGGGMMQDTWKARPLHHGFKYRKVAGEPPQVFTDGQGNPATVNLTAGGVLLPQGNPPEYLSFNRFTKTDFNALSLGPF